MKFKVIIRHVGTSFVVTIPKQIIEALSLKKSDYVLIDVVNNKIIIEKENLINE